MNCDGDDSLSVYLKFLPKLPSLVYTCYLSLHLLNLALKFK